MITGICTECKDNAVGKIVDFGIGSYEFHGQRGTDTRLELVSTCCEAPMRDGAGDLMYAEDFDGQS